MALIMGIDEAGRGSVLGPMVVGGYMLPAELLGDLEATGVTDSKRLSPLRRRRLVPLLEELGTGDVRLVSAQQIDAGNLNALELRVMVDLIRTHRPWHVFIDAPTHPAAIPRFQQALYAALDYRPRFTIEPRADLNWKVVGAASVLAKVRRDEELASLGPVGSGYPSDPITREWIRGFLDRNEDLPSCVRSRWGTIRKLSQQSLFPR